jgi:3-oxoacyl-[acyl-carrier protein] reductase
VLISGGSRGLGQALVKLLLDANYRVSTFSRRSTPFVEEQTRNDRFHFSVADISDRPSVRSFVLEAEKRQGPLYGLINCAGVVADSVLAMMPQDDLDTVLSVNLTGTLYLTRQVIRRMLLSDQGGSIINISSIVGLRGYSGLSVYAATKAGLDAVTRSLARELGPRGIRVNSVAPGFLETEMTGGLSAAQIEQIKRRTPLGRIGHPADAVGPVLFLLSEASCFITGQVLVVDGGLTA